MGKGRADKLTTKCANFFRPPFRLFQFFGKTVTNKVVTQYADGQDQGLEHGQY